MTRPVFAPDVIAALRQALRRDFGSVAVSQALGLAGDAALSRSDLSGVDRLTRGGSPTETWIRLFLLGLAVSREAAGGALHPLSVAAALGAGLLEPASSDTEPPSGQPASGKPTSGRPAGDQRSGAGAVRAALDVRPYSEADGPDWWVVSDLGSDVRPGLLDPEHVLGIGSAATTLAQCTVRSPVARALDIGTGCGVQALHLSRHSASVTATDLSTRALGLAATTAALNELDWDLRQGSLLEPVAGERFDLIVSNPPFIVGPGFAPGRDGYTYRDSGMTADSVSAQLVAGLPGLLSDGGTAQLLANWALTSDQPWQDRLAGWLPRTGCQAWVWQREVTDPGEYVSLWLRDAGEVPGTDSWRRRYDRWLDWFTEAGVLGVGMGLVSIRRTGAGTTDVVCEDVPQPYERPAGAEIEGWFARRTWLRTAGTDGLLDARLRADADLIQTTHSLTGSQGWQPALLNLRRSHGMRWELEVDEAVSGLVAACDGTTTVGVLLSVLASAVSAPVAEVITALAPVVRDLIERGYLIPDDQALATSLLEQDDLGTELA